jgi:hypothetical protein
MHAKLIEAGLGGTARCFQQCHSRREPRQACQAMQCGHMGMLMLRVCTQMVSVPLLRQFFSSRSVVIVVFIHQRMTREQWLCQSAQVCYQISTIPIGLHTRHTMCVFFGGGGRRG